MRAIVIAGTHSGVGKTTVATGIMAALSRRGYKVQPFKAGPDYIDPSYHTRACGLPSRNLDTWLLKEPVVRELFHRAMAGKEIAVIEGVMGLYDGACGENESGSTAYLAKLLRIPVILVLDAWAASRSVGAFALGFKNFDPEVQLAGVILNGIGGPTHLDLIRPALAKCEIPLLGYLPRNSDLAIPERHLGLVPTEEGTTEAGLFDRLAAQAQESIELDKVEAIATGVTTPAGDDTIFPPEAVSPRTAIAVAQDHAFNFYYPDSLDLLKAWGAELAPFSPLSDKQLPRRIGGVYIGGGFPEFFAAELSENRSMLQSLRRAAQRGLPIYAECGGLMYLGETLDDLEGTVRTMARIIPVHSSMRESRLTLGYRTMKTLNDGPLMRSGETVRGHEFHLSSLKKVSEKAVPAYEVLGQGRQEGIRVKNVLASYIHVHLASRKDLAPRFVDLCSQAGGS